MFWKIFKKFIVFMCVSYAVIIVIVMLIETADDDPQKMMDRIVFKLQTAALRKCFKIGKIVAKLQIKQALKNM